MSDYNQKPWFEKESEVGPEKAAAKKRPLKGGTSGKGIVDYFEKEHQRVAVDAEMISDFKREENSVSYRVTFDDNSVEDWKFYYPDFYSFTVTYAEMFNKVI